MQGQFERTVMIMFIISLLEGKVLDWMTTLQGENLALGQISEQSVSLFKAAVNHLVNVYSTFLKAQAREQNVRFPSAFSWLEMNGIKSPLLPLGEDV